MLLGLDDALKIEVQKKIKNGIPHWMLNQIHHDLQYVPKSGITKTVINRTLAQDKSCLSLITIKNGSISIQHQRTVKEHQILTSKPILDALIELSQCISLPNVELIYCSDDAPFNWNNIVADKLASSPAQYIAPVLVCCKNKWDINAVLIPDFHTLNSIKDNIEQKIKMGNTTYPWSSKLNKAFWRGATTGGLYKIHNYHKFPRTKLVQFSTDFSHLIDAKFNFLWEVDHQVRKKFYELNYVSDTVSVIDHIKYKYQILIDGNSASWPRAYWQFQSNSVVFKQDSNFIVWHNDLFKPWIHYIPFEHDCSDLIEKLEWAINHDSEAQKISEQANQIAKYALTYSDILLYFYAVITEYAKFQQYKI